MSGEKMILVLVLALATTNALVCPIQTCGTNEGDLCYSYTTATNTAVSDECAVDHTCQFDYTDLTKNYLCVPDPNPIEYNRWPGQKCSETKVCIDGATCTNGYCVGVAIGGSCTSTDVCAPGAYCKVINTVSTCAALILENQPCGTGDVCYYGHKCFSGLCKKQNVANGQAVDVTSCVASISNLCQSLQCLKSTDGTSAICIAAYKQEGDYVTCDTCTGKSTTANTPTASTSCGCGLSGQSYCYGFLGDTYHSKAISLSYSYLFGSTIRKCNINAGTACMEDYYDDDDYYEFLYYNLRAADNYMLYKATDCVLKAVAANYIKTRDLYEDSSSSSSFGQLFAVSALVLAVIA